jgi:hypothetical protein
MFCMVNETTHLNYTTNCNSLNKLWEQSLWYLSLVCTVWHNSELTWFILDNLADMSVNAGCAFSDRLTHTKELACCCHRFSSQQMLDLQFIVVLRYSWVDMYFAHILVSRMSLMLALMSQIYAVEVLRSLETWDSFFIRTMREVNLNIWYYSEISNLLTDEVILCHHSSGVISCSSNFDLCSWLHWVCKWTFLRPSTDFIAILEQAQRLKQNE